MWFHVQLDHKILKGLYYPSHSSGCHSSERNDTPEAQGDRSVSSHLDTWAESATSIIDRWRPFTGYLFSEKDIFWYRLFIFRKYRQRNETPEAQGDRSVSSHLDTWAESATPIIDVLQVIYSQKKISSDAGYLFLENIGRWRPCTGYSFSEDIFF